MSSLVVTFALTAAASLLLTPLVRRLARRWGVVDRPDNVRKLHGRPVPLLGGAAVYLALVVGIGAAQYGSFGTGPALTQLSLLLVLTAGCVCFFGGVDDYRHLRPRTKLLFQTISVLPMVCFGCVDQVVAFGVPIELGWLGVPLTVLWLVGCINALNLLDGMDGLASIVGLATATMMGLIAGTEGHPHVAVIASVLAGALAGFLVYNLPPASIFLGDSGSMVIGLVVGTLGIHGGMKTSATLSITAPAVVMALPMLDVVLAVIRRRLTGRQIAVADRQHIHHRLLDRGLTPWQVLCVLGAICLTTGAAATTATLFRSDTLAWTITLSLLVLAIRLRLFGHYELSLVKRAVAGGLALLAARLGAPGGSDDPPCPEELAALPFGEVWSLLLEEIRPWKVARMELLLSGPKLPARQFHWTDPAADQHRCTCGLSVNRQRSDGIRCVLEASMLESTGPEWLYMNRLAALLEVFAARFANIPDLPYLTLVNPPSADTVRARQWRSDAA
jgi:UDP-GlcNAc:undecaprenyl-phosphate GlcNAc-1-phosphate transferase